jgi:hypothetical protein
MGESKGISLERTGDGAGGARPGPEELAALADERLPADRAAEIERAAAASPELAAELGEQRRAVEILRAAAADAGGAPASLREGLDRARRPARGRALGRRGALGIAAVAAVLVALMVLALLPTGGGGPTVAQAAAVSARPAAEGPPPADVAQPALLDAAVEGTAFPDWDAEFGWGASGQRADDLDGRETRTVLYEKEGKELGYTIVPGDALDPPEDAREVTSGGVDLELFTQDGRRVVTWLRDGKTCVLSGADVDDATLVKLAVWKGDGAVEF